MTTTLKDIVEASKPDDIDVCTLKIVNIPSTRKAKEIFDLLQPEQIKIIDIKIETRTIKQNETDPTPVIEDRILPEFAIQGPIVVLQTSSQKNKTDMIESLLKDMSTKGSCIKVKFNPDARRYRLKEMQSINYSDRAANQDKIQAKVLELDTFLKGLREKYTSNFPMLLEEKEESEEAKEAADLANDARALMFGKKPSWNNGEKRTALMSVVDDPRQLKKIFNNKDLNSMYVHYIGLRKNLHPPQLLKYRKMYQTKKLVSCENLQLGILHPQNPEKFCCYWDHSKIKEQGSKIYFVYLHLTGKPSKRVQIIYEIPSLNKFVKIEFSFKLCERICVEQGSGDSYNMYFELGYSPRFAVMGYNDTLYQSHVFCEQWDRIPHFGLDPEADSLFNAYLSQSTVIKLSFAKATDELQIFSRIVRSVGMEITNHYSPYFKTIEIKEAMPDLTYNKLLESALSYEAKYALLACLSQKKINLYEVSRDLMRKLEGDNATHQKIVEKTLIDIGNKNRKFGSAERAQLAKNFENFFFSLYEENRISKGQWEHAQAPTHMCKTKRVTITPTVIMYYTEEAELSNSVLRRFKDKTGQFMRVTLSDEVGEGVKNMVYISETRFKKLLQDLPILGRSYKALAFSSSQLKNNSLWMLTETKDFSVETVHRQIGNLSEIKNPARYAARLGQLFSASFAVLNIDKSLITVEEIPDVKVVTDDIEYNFSDGVGKISMDLLRQIKTNRKIKGIVSAVQIRCGGVKGILVGDPELGDRAKKICFRKSMIKFKNSSFENSLELLDYSKYRPGYLNRQIILLLLTNGLDPQIFYELQEENIRDLSKKENNDGNIFAYINNEHHLSPTKDLLKDCVDAEIDISREPFVRGVVETIRIRSFINLKEKCNILVEKSTRLTGVLDEYGILNNGEMYVCISESNGEKNDFQVIKAERIVITKNPCLHAGDIRILKAVDNPEVRARFAHLVNVIVFPRKGDRPHTDEISGSDLDGDMYFISWDERLIPNCMTPPMSYAGKKPEDRPVDMDAIVSFFIEFANNDVLGKIDNAHLAIADDSPDLAAAQDCLKLSEMHAVAVDYAKTGICPTIKISLAKFFPDYMEKEPELTKESNTVMGDLFRLIKSEIECTGVKKVYRDGCKKLQQEVTIDEDMVVDGFESYLHQAFQALEEYYKDTHAVMNLYKIQTEYEIYSGNFLKFMSKGKSKKYNLEKMQEKMIEHIETMKDKLLGNLLNEFDSQDQIISDNKYTDAVRRKASAVYIVSYYRGKDKCSIEKVNRALDKVEFGQVYEKKFASYENQLIGLPWFIFKEVILEVKKENKFKREESKKKGK